MASMQLGKLRQRWLALLALAIAAPIGTLCTLHTLAWVGQPFPGFFVLENGLILRCCRTSGPYSDRNVSPFMTPLKCSVAVHADCCEQSAGVSSDDRSVLAYRKSPHRKPPGHPTTLFAPPMALAPHQDTHLAAIAIGISVVHSNDADFALSPTARA